MRHAANIIEKLRKLIAVMRNHAVNVLPAMLRVSACLAICVATFPHSFFILNAIMVAYLIFTYDDAVVSGATSFSNSIDVLIAISAFAYYLMFLLIMSGHIVDSGLLYNIVLKNSFFSNEVSYFASFPDADKRIEYFNIVLIETFFPYLFWCVNASMCRFYFGLIMSKCLYPSWRNIVLPIMIVAIITAAIVNSYLNNAYRVDVKSIHPIVDAAFGMLRKSDLHVAINMLFWSTSTSYFAFLQAMVIMCLVSEIKRLARRL